MLDIFAQFATDENAESSGVWREIGGGAELLIARLGNRQYGKLLNKVFEANKKVLDLGDDVADKKSDELMVEVLAKTVLLGWKNVSFKGEVLEYSVEKAKMLLSIKDFRRQVTQLADEMDAYRAKEEQEQGEA